MSSHVSHTEGYWCLLRCTLRCVVVLTFYYVCVSVYIIVFNRTHASAHDLCVQQEQMISSFKRLKVLRSTTERGATHAVQTYWPYKQSPSLLISQVPDPSTAAPLNRAAASRALQSEEPPMQFQDTPLGMLQDMLSLPVNQ